MQAVQLAYDPGDAHPGGLLEVAGYGQSGHQHRQVGLDGIASVVEDGGGLSGHACSSVNDCSGMPQLVIRGYDLGSIHQTGRDER